MKTTERDSARKPRRLRNLAPLLLSGLALFAATSGAAMALPGSNTVTSGDIVDGKVKSKDIKDGNGVKSRDIADAAVGSEELGGFHSHGASTTILGGVGQNGNYNVGSRTASCGAGEQLVSGSAHWANEGSSDELFIQEIILSHASGSVTVKAGNDSGNNRTLVAVAHCVS